MPVHQNADILEPPTKSKRWPVMIFSHGLGGTRNAYSHICGSLASHGIVVVAPDHRDGSSPLSIYHTPEEKEKTRRVGYRPIAHKPSTDVYEARDEQLRIRLCELGFIHDALLKVDQGQKLKNVAHEHHTKHHKEMLDMFSNLLNVHEPGAIALAGHSFGACTMIQFVKSVYYRPQQDIAGYKPLYTPIADSNIVRQITPATPVTLLDLWTLPIQSPNTAWLRSQPMPSYDAPTGGRNLLAILSEGFYNWTSNFNEVKRIIAKPAKSKYSNQPSAHIFYPISSAHLSQSDFGVLFPWATTKIFGAKEPERVLKLNTRAILQVLRDSGVPVANTSAQDLELDESKAQDASTTQDTTILSKTKGSVRDWVNLSADMDGGLDFSGLDQQGVQSPVGTPLERVGSAKVGTGPGEAMLEGEVLGQFVKDTER
jgi:platelet-activating factor acetylhydrolase